MKLARRLFALRLLASILSLLAVLPQPAHAERHPIDIREWQVKWIPDDAVSDRKPSASGPWTDTSVYNPLTSVPDGMRGMWVHFTVPPTSGWQRPAMLVERLYGLELSVYQGNRLLYASKRDFRYEMNKLLVPIGSTADSQDFYIRIITTGERIGIISGIRIGDSEALSNRFATRDLPDLLLGTSIVFLAFIMLLCSGFLQTKQRRSWISQCLIAGTLGTLIVTYSPLPYIYFKPYGNLLWMLFDVALFVLIPSFNYFIDEVFEGQFYYFTKFRHLQTGYSIFCLAALAVNMASHERYYGIYILFQNGIMSILMLTQLLLIIVLSFFTALKGNKDALILLTGIILFALSGTADLILYFASDRTYVLFLWKIGVVILIVALVAILARRISADYAKLVDYSKELAVYNHSLQRTEKLKIISDLAASVAHEVRNPLQVTRGFLQLLAERTDDKSKSYFELATNELDRAADIITDFLTFAKPEIDDIQLLNLSEELRKIETMMTPLAAMHGGILTFTAQDGLHLYGNSSKLKQALINMIKNSIEAIGVDGLIEIKARSEGGDVVITIKDNGEGMNEEEIAKLGEPFFSTKTKGTGLGLMVTFRIIEVMKGTIRFRSVKAEGTEVIIRFPQATQDNVLPDVIRA